MGNAILMGMQMNKLDAYPLGLYFWIVLQLIVVAFVDVIEKRIANMWTIANVVTYCLLLAFASDYFPISWSHFLFASVFIFVGYILFVLKIMGGGDSKYIFSIFLLTHFSLQELLMEYLLLSTIVAGMSFFTVNFITYRDDVWFAMRTGNVRGITKNFGKKFAFSPVLLLAWVLLGWNIYL